MSDPLDLLSDVIRAVAPSVDAAAWAAAFAGPMRDAGITTEPRIAMFVGQVSEETGGLREFTEDMDYSAERMMVEWPSRFPTLASAEPYAHNPEALANHVYADRGGNGDEASGDGYRFRGGGGLQVTFRDTYAALGAKVGKSAEDAATWARTTQQGAAFSACWVWGRFKGLNELSDAWDITSVTRIINGGLSNLAVREQACNAALAVFGDVPGTPAQVLTPVQSSNSDDSADALNEAEQAQIEGGQPPPAA